MPIHPLSIVGMPGGFDVQSGKSSAGAIETNLQPRLLCRQMKVDVGLKAVSSFFVLQRYGVTRQR